MVIAPSRLSSSTLTHIQTTKKSSVLSPDLLVLPNRLSLLRMIKMVPHGVRPQQTHTSRLSLATFWDGFFQGFDGELKDASLHGPRIEWWWIGRYEQFLGVEKYFEWPCKRCRGLCFDKLGREFEATNDWVCPFIHSLYRPMLI